MISINLFFPLMFHHAAEWDPTFRHHSHSTTLELQDGKITSKVPFYYGGEGLMFHKRKMFLPRAFAERFIEALKCAVSGGAYCFVSFHSQQMFCFKPTMVWDKTNVYNRLWKKRLSGNQSIVLRKTLIGNVLIQKKIYNSWEKYTCRWYFPIYVPLSGEQGRKEKWKEKKPHSERKAENCGECVGGYSLWLLPRDVTRQRLKFPAVPTAPQVKMRPPAIEPWSTVPRLTRTFKLPAKQKSAIDVENATGLTAENFLLKMTNAWFFQVDIRFSSNLRRLDFG